MAVEDGLSSVYSGRDKTGEAVVYPHSSVNSTDYFLKTLEGRQKRDDAMETQRRKATHADLIQASKDTDVSKAWYVDQPELMKDVDQLKQLGALSINPKAPKDVRANAGVMYQSKKIDLQNKVAASTQQKQDLSSKVNFGTTHYNHLTDESKAQFDNFVKSGIQGRQPLKFELKPDFNYIKGYKQSVNPTGLTDVKAYETVSDDGFTKKKVYKKEISPEKSHQAFRNYLQQSSEGQEWEGNLRAQFESIDGIEEMKAQKPAEYAKQWDNFLNDHADQINGTLVQEVVKTGVGSAPRKPKDKIPTVQKAKADLQKEGVISEQTDPFVDYEDGFKTSFKRKARVMTIPHNSKNTVPLIMNDDFKIKGADLKKDEEFYFDPSQIVSFSGDDNFVKGVGKRKVEHDDGKVTEEQFSAKIPLKTMANVFKQNGVQFEWATEKGALKTQAQPEKTKDNPAGVKYELPAGKPRRGRKGDKWYVWDEQTGKYKAE